MIIFLLQSVFILFSLLIHIYLNGIDGKPKRRARARPSSANALAVVHDYDNIVSGGNDGRRDRSTSFQLNRIRAMSFASE